MRKKENTGFVCQNCGQNVLPLTNGSFRNHCPFCLCSKHVDKSPGDRANSCKGLMIPTDLIYTGKKGYQLVHTCKRCGKTQKNIVADNTVQPDQLVLWLKSQRL